MWQHVNNRSFSFQHRPFIIEVKKGVESMSPTIGKKIQLLRKNEGISQQELADKINVSRQTISKWESDLSLPDIESLVKISHLFNISINELLDVENNQQERVPITYEQIQTVLTNIQKENKKRNLIQIIMMLVCVISLILMISMKMDLKDKPIDSSILETEHIPSSIFFDPITTYTESSELFLGEWQGKYRTYANITELNFDEETITLDYQFVLKEYTPNTQVSIEFMGLISDPFTIVFDRIDQNVFASKATIPLEIYDSINLTIALDNKTVVESITYHENSLFLRMLAKHICNFSIPVDENNKLRLDTIQYSPNEIYSFNVIGTPNATFSFRLYDENHEPLTKYIYTDFSKQKMEETYKPLPLNKKIYYELSCDFSIGPSQITYHFNDGLGSSDPSAITEYFIIEDTQNPFVICSYY